MDKIEPVAKVGVTWAGEECNTVTWMPGNALLADGTNLYAESDVSALLSENARYKEALDHIGGLSRALRYSGPAPEDLQELSDALREAVDTAHTTLSTEEKT